jgi:photosystem II stability/assembly factor-like uncharacterized protein
MKGNRFMNGSTSLLVLPLLALMLSANAAADTQKKWWLQNPPLGTGGAVTMHFANAKDGWVVGSDHSLASTTDSGKTWTRRLTGRAAGVYAISAGEVWITDCDAGGTLHHSVDTGLTWDTVVTGFGGTRIIYFRGAQGFLVGDESYIMLSVDSGKTWTRSGTVPYADYYSIMFCDSLHGWMSGVNATSVLCKTVDGGVTWERKEIASEDPLHSVFAVDSSIVYTVGGDGYRSVYWYSRDGGATWTGGDNLLPDIDYRWIYFIDRDRGFCSNDRGTICRTFDGGVTWPEKITIGFGYRSLQIIDPATVYTLITSPGGISINRSFDTCATWSPQKTPPLFGFNFIEASFNSPAQGVVLADSCIVGTVDGGVHWEAIPLPDDPALPFVRIASPEVNSIRVVSKKGIVYSSDTWGERWDQSTFPEGFGMTDFCLLGREKGWILGTRNGSCVVLASNGNTGGFEEIWSDTALKDVRSIDFTDSGNGWISGGKGLILRTRDGGATWTKLPEITMKIITRVDFVDTSTGWFATDRDSAYSTGNGGETWNSYRVGTIVNMAGLRAIDTARAIVAGTRTYERFAADPYYYAELNVKTPANWQTILSHSVLDLSYRFASFSDSLCWVVGKNGLITRYSATPDPYAMGVRHEKEKKIAHLPRNNAFYSKKNNMLGLRTRCRFDAHYTLKIYELRGRLVYSAEIDGARGSTKSNGALLIPMGNRSLANSFYICNLQEPSGKEPPLAFRLIVQ